MATSNRRRFLQDSLGLAGLGLLAGCGRSVFPGSVSKQLPRVGFLDATSPLVRARSMEAFREGLRAQGLGEGQDYILEVRFAEGSNERLPALADELVRLPVDVIVTLSLPAVLAARDATATTPIVMAGVGVDPVALGLAASLARPGGNVTGIANLNVAVTSKRVGLLRETLPVLDRLALLDDLNGAARGVATEEGRSAAGALGIQFSALPLRDESDLEAAFEAATRQQVHALLVPGSPFFQSNLDRIVELAAQHRLPAIYPHRLFVEAGGLMGYATNEATNFRKAAMYVHKILAGTKVADLPIEQPTEFDFVINLKTAYALGLTIPPSVLQQATEVIE